MNILKRSISPITNEAWEEIDSQAKQVLEAHLSARKFVDVTDPRGWEYSAVPLGRLEIYNDNVEENLGYGIRQSKPLIEPRVRFELNIMELDNINRGAKDIDLAPLEAAAKQIAHFEENAVYHGFQQAGIVGLCKVAQYESLLSEDPNEILTSVSSALTTLLEASVAGPYAMVLNPTQWRALASYVRGYPVRRHIENLIGGPVIYSSEISDGLLVSMRGGDLELILGQDFSIGYEYHDHQTVKLFITETFTFRILDPAIMVRLKTKT